MRGCVVSGDLDRLRELATAATDLPAAASPEDAAVRAALVAARAAQADAALAAVAAGRDARYQAAWLRARLADLPAHGYWRAVS